MREVLRSGVVRWNSAVVFHCDFEGGLAPWEQVGDTINWSVSRVTSAAFADRYGVRLRTGRVLVPPVGDGRMQARVPNGYDRRVTFDVRWRFLLRDRLRYVTFRVRGVRVDGSYLTGVRYDVGEQRWYLQVGGFAWLDLKGNPQALSGDSWHRVRYGFDLDSGKYVGFRSDDKRYDVGGRGYTSFANGSDTECRLQLEVTCDDGAGTGVEYDEVLLYDGDLMDHG